MKNIWVRNIKKNHMKHKPLFVIWSIHNIKISNLIMKFLLCMNRFYAMCIIWKHVLSSFMGACHLFCDFSWKEQWFPSKCTSNNPIRNRKFSLLANHMYWNYETKLIFEANLCKLYFYFACFLCDAYHLKARFKLFLERV